MIGRRELLQQLTTGLALAGTPLLGHAITKQASFGRWDPATFLQKTPQSAGAALSTGDRPVGRNLIVGFGVAKEDPAAKDWDLSLTSIALHGAGGATMYRILMPHFAHGVLQHPSHPHQVVTFQKRGPGSALVDLVKGEVLRAIETKATHQFYGHGAFTTDGLLLATETNLADNFRGLIAVRDAETYEWLGEFPSFGPGPHDCRLIDDGKTLVVANGGGPLALDGKPSVAYVDVASQRLLEKLEFKRDDMNAGHLAISSRGDLIAISSFRDGMEDTPNARGGVSFRPAGGSFRTLTDPKELIESLYGETLSVALHEPSNTFAVTTPQGNWLSFWDLTTGELKYAEEVPQPKGVVLTPDGAHFAVTYTYRGRALLSQWSTRTLQRVPARDLLDVYISGSHLVNLQITA